MSPMLQSSSRAREHTANLTHPASLRTDAGGWSAFLQLQVSMALAVYPTFCPCIWRSGRHLPPWTCQWCESCKARGQPEFFLPCVPLLTDGKVIWMHLCVETWWGLTQPALEKLLRIPPGNRFLAPTLRQDLYFWQDYGVSVQMDRLGEEIRCATATTSRQLACALPLCSCTGCPPPATQRECGVLSQSHESY